MLGLGLIKGLSVTIVRFLATFWDDLSHWVLLRRYRYSDRIWRPPSPQKKGIFTIQYPEERMEMFPRFRGTLMQMRDPETGKPKCTACGACVRACPHGAIEMTTKKDEESGKRVIETYVVHNENCMVCGLCVEACPFDALKMGRDYELAEYNRANLLYDFEKLLAIGDKYAQLAGKGGEKA